MVQCIGIFFEANMPAPCIYATLAKVNLLPSMDFVDWPELCDGKR